VSRRRGGLDLASSGNGMVMFGTRSCPGGGEAWISLDLVMEWSCLGPGPVQEAGRPGSR
jgi:hypothetical protein